MICKEKHAKITFILWVHKLTTCFFSFLWNYFVPTSCYMYHTIRMSSYDLFFLRDMQGSTNVLLFSTYTLPLFWHIFFSHLSSGKFAKLEPYLFHVHTWQNLHNWCYASCIFHFILILVWCYLSALWWKIVNVAQKYSEDFVFILSSTLFDFTKAFVTLGQ